PWRLGAVHAVTTLTGSALIAIALARGALSVDAAWAAAHVDEDWNMEFWGRDQLALEHRAARFAGMQAAAPGWEAAHEGATFGSGCSLLLLLERAVGDDGSALNAAEPAEREIVPLPRDGDGAVRTATAFLGLALGDGLGVEEVGFR